MVHLRKILFLSALLMSTSSLTAPTYAMKDDEQDRTSVPEPVATTSMQVPLSIAPSFVDYSSIAADPNS